MCPQWRMTKDRRRRLRPFPCGHARGRGAHDYVCACARPVHMCAHRWSRPRSTSFHLPPLPPHQHGGAHPLPGFHRERRRREGRRKRRSLTVRGGKRCEAATRETDLGHYSDRRQRRRAGLFARALVLLELWKAAKGLDKCVGVVWAVAGLCESSAEAGGLVW